MCSRFSPSERLTMNSFNVSLELALLHMNAIKLVVMAIFEEICQFPGRFSKRFIQIRSILGTPQSYWHFLHHINVEASFELLDNGFFFLEKILE